MISVHRFALVLTLAGIFARSGAAAEADHFDLKAGQEVTLPVVIAEGRVTFGAPRASKFGTSQPRQGEMTSRPLAQGQDAVRKVTVVEKTAKPIDFVATGLIGGTKIDETVLCGRLDGVASARIGAVSWRVSLNQFSLRSESVGCP